MKCAWCMGDGEPPFGVQDAVTVAFGFAVCEQHFQEISLNAAAVVRDSLQEAPS